MVRASFSPRIPRATSPLAPQSTQAFVSTSTRIRPGSKQVARNKTGTDIQSEVNILKGLRDKKMAGLSAGFF